MPPTLRFAHFSDPHLPLPPGWPPGWPERLGALAGKRLLGFLSWRRKRHRIHRPDILAALLSDVAAHAPDHVVVTGDLVNIALPDEFDRARLWLEGLQGQGLGSPDRVSVVPGNHDATVAVPWDRGIGLWLPWMAGDDGPDRFPFLRVRGPAAFVGVSTAVPTPPLLATGAVGAEQAERLETLLGDLSRRGLFRVVLMHHPPMRIHGSARKALSDRDRVRAVLARTGAELVLHGHHHREHVGAIAGPDGGAIPVIGVPSASAAPVGRAQAARWVQFTVEAAAEGGWRLGVLVRGFDGQGFATAARFAIAYGAAQKP